GNSAKVSCEMRKKLFVLGANIVASFILLASQRAWAQSAADEAPKIVNGRLETRALPGSLSQEFQRLLDKTAEPTWVGYAEPQVAGDRLLCCGNYDVTRDGVRGWCGNCRLEGRDDGTNVTSRDNGIVRLEGGQRVLVLFRVEQEQISKIRVVSEDCTLDAGGRTLIWLTGVKPPESVAWLKGFAVKEKHDGHGKHSVSDSALTAIAMHADTAADRALESFAAPDKPEELRKDTTFWLGEARGKTGLAALEKMAKNDPSPDVREEISFAYSVSQEPGALNDMIRMAHEDGSARVRSQALFWLAQKAGEKAVGAIKGAIENDPDAEVKKQAVFALSQLPEDEGVPKLIEVAQTNRNAEVRKQAMFWLGQSEDPRARVF
ncbi:MAG TPA: HEAT repeat domain-containing protein, partial [Candidatus Methylomirabilis sp.]|nr:HEAT repeat domain-containing protein [Candidatus Methylomirabilis sp.]